MAEIVNPLPKEQKQDAQPLSDAVTDACSSQPPLPSVDLSSKDDKGQAVTPKLTLRKRNSDFALTSYNSAFLEDLFDDIAAAQEDEAKTESPDPSPTTEATLSVAYPSDHSLAKRRRVSTNKSLGRCGQSLANLASCADLASFRMGVRKKSSVVIAPKFAASKAPPKTELVATVSASLSFNLDLGLAEDSKPEESKNEKCQQGDFGWFIDTDDQEDFGFQKGLSASSSAPALVPLAFSASTAPVGPSEEQQAEVEWAQAADTVDEVLGDFF